MEAQRIRECEKIIELEIERLSDFKNHPFKVEEDNDMLLLYESILMYGVLEPLIIRPLKNGSYEVVSGHRRKYAAKKAGHIKVPVIIRTMSDAEAVLFMVDSNLNREKISPSEKAFAYKMKYDAMRRTAGRKGSHSDHQYKGQRTVAVIGKELGDSSKQVQRYLKITELIPELLKKLDEGGLSLTPAVELAYLKPANQKLVLEAMDTTQAMPSLSQAQRIRKKCTEGKVTLDDMVEILGEVKKGEIKRVEFKNEQLYKYFPKNYTLARIKKELLAMMKLYYEENNATI